MRKMIIEVRPHDRYLEVRKVVRSYHNYPSSFGAGTYLVLTARAYEDAPASLFLEEILVATRLLYGRDSSAREEGWVTYS